VSTDWPEEGPVLKPELVSSTDLDRAEDYLRSVAILLDEAQRHTSSRHMHIRLGRMKGLIRDYFDPE
jgi:hypothetical protein